MPISKSFDHHELTLLAKTNLWKLDIEGQVHNIPTVSIHTITKVILTGSVNNGIINGKHQR